MSGMINAAQRALAATQAFLALGNERFEAEGATFVRNRETPSIWDANHMTRITASTPEAIARLIARAEQEFAGCRNRSFHLDFTTPPAFEAALTLEGYAGGEELVMLLEGELAAEAKPHDIRPVADEGTWRAYAALFEIDWREFNARRPAPFDDETAAQMLQARRLKAPPVRHWLGYVDGEPKAYLSSWGGADGVGQVEDLFTHPDYRRRGLATALIHRCVAAARRDGAGPVVIMADPADTPKNMYAALGFRPVAVRRQRVKRLAS